MKKLLRCKSDLLILFTVGLLSVVFWVVPAMAGEMAAEFAKVAKAEKFTAQAYKMSVKAEETGNVELNEEVLKVLKDGTELLSEVAPIAYEAGVVKLCQRVLNAAKRSQFLIAQIMNTVENIIQTSTDAKVVDAAKAILVKAGALQDENQINIKISLACGAVPEPAKAYEPPEEPFPDPPKPEPPEPGSEI
jgi:2-phospho-L-lactate guanylyltransferase (CobY/MobA/RfbA family)